MPRAPSELARAVDPGTRRPVIVPASPGPRSRRHRGFSLLELVIVVVIIGIVASIAIPRLSSASQSAAAKATLADLAVMNQAVQHYWAEHAAYPDEASVADQLTMFSDTTGAKLESARDDAQGVIFGPYLRSVPALPIGPNAGNTAIAPAPGPGVGWIYRNADRLVLPNLFDGGGEVDDDATEGLPKDLVDAVKGVVSGGGGTVGP